MALIFSKQVLFQGTSICQITIVGQRNPKRRIHIKRLRLFWVIRTSRSRVANVTESHASLKTHHVTCFKHLTNESFPLSKMKFRTIIRHDSSGILPSMLKHDQPIIDILSHMPIPHHSNNSTHRDKD